MKNIDSIEQLEYLIQQFQGTIDNLKLQRNSEVKMWQKKYQEMQNQISNVNQQLENTILENQKLKNEMSLIINDFEKIKSQNITLNSVLKEKEKEITNFYNLNQSLKQLLDQSTTNVSKTSKINYEDFEYTNKEYISEYSPKNKNLKTESVTSNGIPQQGSHSKSSIFIKTAKEELTYTDFNQMIAEINKYNKKIQTRDETNSNVKSILYPSHKNLYNQFIDLLSGV